MSLDKQIEQITLAVNASSGAIMIRSKENENLLVCGASFNMPNEWVELTNLVENNPKNINGTVAYTGVPIVMNKFNRIFHGYPIASVIVVPVIADGRVAANIEVIHDTENESFSDKDLEYLQVEAHNLAKNIQALAV